LHTTEIMQQRKFPFTSQPVCCSQGTGTMYSDIQRYLLRFAACYCLLSNNPGQTMNTEVSTTSYKLNDQRILIRFLTEQEIFPLPEMSRPAPDPKQPPIQLVEGCTQECHLSWLSQDSPGLMGFKELCPIVLKNLVWDAKCPEFSQLIKIQQS